MIGKILVPLDGTELAAAALAYAEVIAEHTGASLALVRIVSGESASADLHLMLQEAESYLAHAAEPLIQKGFHVETGVPYGGSAAKWIIEEVEMRQADLIVMATHGRLGRERWLHGSTAEAVVHGSTVPVMLVRAESSSLLAQRLSILKPALVVPLDGTAMAESALPIARELADAIEAELKLVQVLPSDGGATLEEEAADVCTDTAREREAAAYLQDIANLIEGEAVPVETELGYGDPTRGISATANEAGAAAIVMATHGRTGVVRSIMGSVAGSVFRSSTAPVVLIGPAVLPSAERSAPAHARISE
jgi:nucleotide-binding universal stress UspA family protein